MQEMGQRRAAGLLGRVGIEEDGEVCCSSWERGRGTWSEGRIHDCIAYWVKFRHPSPVKLFAFGCLG